jgi:hypothetical protein
MNAWRSLLAVLAAVITAGTFAHASPSGAVLQNLRGDVQYSTADAAPAQPLAPKTSTVLSEGDIVRTGNESLAAITFVDSSQVVMGNNSALKFLSFSNDQMAHARVALLNGEIRFTVNHPNGRPADYAFTTPIGQVVVRGTIGYIYADPVGVRVAIFAGHLPVAVEALDGSVYVVTAGQEIRMRWTSGKLAAKITPFTNGFEELGTP